MPSAMTMMSEWVLFLLSLQAAVIAASEQTVSPAPPPVVFQCGGSPCPAGQDCISINGVLRCADPCSQYSALDDAWRSTDFRNDGNLHCDMYVDWQGWYRMFLGGISTQMPEVCVEENMCGTDSPMWLTAPHPLLGDGVVERGVCGSWGDDCCYFKANPIHVKACPGNYYVYKFVESSGCNTAYCAVSQGNATTPVPPSTTPPPVVFQCGGSPCPAGQDCISVNGVLRCADPCSQYSVLDDAWRSTDYYDGMERCDQDVNWQGWYRMFLGGIGTRMPDTCVKENLCGTHAPLYLTAPHPLLGDGVVERGVCGNFFDDCCGFTSKPIHVKACPGNYYVYKFGGVQGCFLAYCAEAVPISPELVCERTYLDVGVHTSQFEAKNLDLSSAHLADPSCSAKERNGTAWFHMRRKEGSCGTVLTSNSTHAIYSNSLFIYPISETMVQPLIVPFSCSYPLDTEASLDVAIKPYLELGNDVSSEGPKAKTSMSLFREANYTAPYSAGPVTLPVGSVLHVGVSVEETDPQVFVVVLEDCYATHSSDPDDPLKHFLIHDKCPTNRRQGALQGRDEPRQLPGDQEQVPGQEVQAPGAGPGDRGAASQGSLPQHVRGPLPPLHGPQHALQRGGVPGRVPPAPQQGVHVREQARQRRPAQSAETAGRVTQRHEGGRDPSPGNDRQDTSGCREAADVGEEHPEPAGQQGARDTEPAGTRSADVTAVAWPWSDLSPPLTTPLPHHLDIPDWRSRR